MMAGVPDARFDAVQLYKFVTGRDPRHTGQRGVIGQRREFNGLVEKLHGRAQPISLAACRYQSAR